MYNRALEGRQRARARAKGYRNRRGVNQRGGQNIVPAHDYHIIMRVHAAKI